MPWPREAFGIPLTLSVAAAVVVLNILPSLTYVVIAARLGLIDVNHLNRIPAEQLLIAQNVTYVPLGIFLLFVLPRVARVSGRDLGLRVPTARELGIGALGTVAMWLGVSLAGALVMAITHRHDTEAAVNLLQQMKTPAQLTLVVVTVCVVGPMIEELTFRLFLFNAISRYASIPVAIVASGLVFGAVHATSLAQLATVGIPLAIGGMILAYVYARTRSYWASVATHGLFNAISTVAIFVFHVKP